MQELQKDKFGVKILPKQYIGFGAIKVGSSLTKNVAIDNTSDLPVTLVSVTVKGDQSVCSFKTVFSHQEAPDVIAILPPRSNFNMKVSMAEVTDKCQSIMLAILYDVVIFSNSQLKICVMCVEL